MDFFLELIIELFQAFLYHHPKLFLLIPDYRYLGT